VLARARWWRGTAWNGLPTAVRSAAGVGNEEQHGMWVEGSGNGKEERGIGCRCSGGACAREK
jgi:hypothetical protein